MEHLEFYELPADPFQNDADARFYYESAPQKRARLRLLRGIHQKKALSVLVGGPGLGKTTLAQVVLRALEEKDYAAHYLSIPHEACSSAWLLPNVARGFGVPVPAHEVHQLIDQIQGQLVAITTARRTPVLLIDEAQLFRNREAMEEFRGLLNLTHDGRKLLSLALFGLPELGELLKLDPPLAQRVEVRVEMTAMDWLESQAYVSHRLRLAGAEHPVFSPDALEALFRWSGGVPRVLNTLADNSLFEGYLTETRPVDSSVVQAAAEALGLFRVASDSVPNIPPVAAPAPDLLGATEPAPEARAQQRKETLSVPRPSPAPRAKPAEAADVTAPDWLEPVAPVPDRTAITPPTPKSVAREAVIEPAVPAELDLDLEEVVAEETLPPTPVKARPALRPDPEPEAEPELAQLAELELAEPERQIERADDDDSKGALGLESDEEADFSLGSLMQEGDEESALAQLAPEREPAPELELEPEPEPDLAPVRRTPPAAKPAAAAAAAPKPAPAPPTPARAVPVRPAAPRPAPATPARATPAKPSPGVPANGEDSFDLRNLVDEEESPRAPLKPPAKERDEDDLDALFDEIQIGDK